MKNPLFPTWKEVTTEEKDNKAFCDELFEETISRIVGNTITETINTIPYDDIAYFLGRLEDGLCFPRTVLSEDVGSVSIGNNSWSSSNSSFYNTSLGSAWSTTDSTTDTSNLIWNNIASDSVVESNVTNIINTVL